jgi:hypothetical protein
METWLDRTEAFAAPDWASWRHNAIGKPSRFRSYLEWSRPLDASVSPRPATRSPSMGVKRKAGTPGFETSSKRPTARIPCKSHYGHCGADNLEYHGQDNMTKKGSSFRGFCQLRTLPEPSIRPSLPGQPNPLNQSDGCYTSDERGIVQGFAGFSDNSGGGGRKDFGGRQGRLAAQVRFPLANLWRRGVRLIRRTFDRSSSERGFFGRTD